jgi:hypothetical protein
MKKIIILVLTLLALIASIWWYSRTSSLNSNASIQIKDGSQIGKIFIADMKGGQVTLVKKGKVWMIHDTVLARQDAIDNILEVLAKTSATQPVPASMHNNAIRNLSTYGVKVEIYNNDNKLMEAFTIGEMINEKDGNYALKAGQERPYIYKKTSFEGDLINYFFTNPNAWISRLIVNYTYNDLKKVTVLYGDNIDSSFTINNENDVLEMAPINKAIKVDYSKAKVRQYLNGFTQKYCLDYETKIKDIDSIITKGRPFAILAMENIKQKKDTLFLIYYKANQKSKETVLIDGVVYDMKYMFAYNRKFLMTIKTESYKDILSRPDFFKK